MNQHPLLSELENLVDGGLDADQEAAIRSHVMECPLCSGVLEDIARQRNIAHEPTLKWSFSESGFSEGDREFEEILLRNRPRRPDEAPRTVFPGPPSATAPLGSVDHYDILQLLGQGSFGEVYLAHDRRLERKVALKVLRPKFARSEHFRKQLQDEAIRIARIRSDHVVEVYDVRCQEESSVQFIVMEYVEGCSLSTYLEGREKAGEASKKDPQEVVRWLYQAALGVQAIHQRGYTHNDLKQGNLLVELIDSSIPGTSRQVCRVKIADFGLLQSLSAEDRKLASDTAGGTETYMSPQRLESPGDTDTRDDIYSLGVILYHLLTGQFPRLSQETEQIRQQARSLSRGSERAECLRKFRKSLLNDIRTQRLRPMSSFNPAVNAELDSIVAACLGVERPDRYRSASELADDLLAWSERRPVKAHGRSVSYAMRKWCTRHPLASGLTVFFIVAISVFMVNSELNTLRLRGEVDQAFDEAERQVADRDYSQALASLRGLIGRIENNSRMHPELERARRFASAIDAPVKANFAKDRFHASVQQAERFLAPPAKPGSVEPALNAYDMALSALNVLQDPEWSSDLLFKSLPETEQNQLRKEVDTAMLHSMELQHRGQLRSCLSLGLKCQIRAPRQSESLVLSEVAADVPIGQTRTPLLRKGDLLLTINGKSATDSETLQQFVTTLSDSAVSSFTLTVLRADNPQPVLLTLNRDADGALTVPMQRASWAIASDVLAQSSLLQEGIVPGDALIGINDQSLVARIPAESMQSRDKILVGCLLNLLATQGETAKLTFVSPRNVSVKSVIVPWTEECRMSAELSHIQILRKRIRQEYGGYVMATLTKLPGMLEKYDIKDASLPLRDVVIHSYYRKGGWPADLVAAAYDIVHAEIESAPAFKKAIELCATARFPEAHQQIDLHLLQDATDPDALQLKILCCKGEKQPAAEAEACTMAISRLPLMPSYKYFRADAYLRLDALDLALRDIDAALSFFPDNSDYLLVRQKIMDAKNESTIAPN